MDMKQFKVLDDRVLLKDADAIEKIGNIIVPIASKMQSIQMEVILVGPGAKTKDGTIIEMSVKPGDIVIIDKTDSIEITLENQKYLMTREKKILAVRD